MAALPPHLPALGDHHLLPLPAQLHRGGGVVPKEPVSFKEALLQLKLKFLQLSITWSIIMSMRHIKKFWFT